MNKKPHVDHPQEWKKYKKGMCQGCWAGCCTMPVEVHSSDLIRLGLTNEYEVENSEKKVASRLLKEGLIKSYRASTGLFVLAQRNGTDCLYLDKNRVCSVYEKRPEVCRKFPNIGVRPGYCPAGPA